MALSSWPVWLAVSTMPASVRMDTIALKRPVTTRPGRIGVMVADIVFSGIPIQ